MLTARGSVADLPGALVGEARSVSARSAIAPDGGVVRLQQPPLGVLLGALGGMQRTLLLAQVAGDVLLVPKLRNMLSARIVMMMSSSRLVISAMPRSRAQ